MTQQRQLEHIKFKWESMSDKLRWKALPSLQVNHPNLIVNLDNDMTFITHKDIEPEEEDFILEFDEYIGWSDGVQTLLKAFNIKAEPV